MHEWEQLAIAGGSCLVGGYLLAQLSAVMSPSGNNSGIIDESAWEIPLLFGLVAMVAGVFILFIAIVKLIGAST